MYKKFFFAAAIIILFDSCYLFFKQFSSGVYSHLSWKCWLISIVLLLISFLPLSSITFKAAGRRLYEYIIKFYYFHFINLRFFASFLLIIAAGIFFRLYRLDYFPWGSEGLLLDSSYFGQYAFKILDGEPYTPIGCGYCGYHDTLPFYLYAMFFSIFGPTVTVLKCETVFIGFVNAVLVFFTIKAILRTCIMRSESNENSGNDYNTVLIALAGMGLYLFSAVDTVLNYSAFHATITTPIALGGFLSLVWAFNKRTYFSFCFTGLLFGLLLSSSYYFLPTAPAFIVVIAYYPISNFFGRFKSVPSARTAYSKGDGSCVKTSLSSTLLQVGMFFLGTLFTVLPKILYLFYNYSDYFFRTFVVTNMDGMAREHNLVAILNNLVLKLSSPFTYDTIKLMFFEGTRGKFMLANCSIPIFDKLVTPVFFLGLIYSFARIKSERYLFLICYLFFTIVHCIISFPIDYRFIPFMPFLYIFFAIGLNLISKLLKYRKIFYILAGIYLLVIVSFNVKNYYTGMGMKPLESFYHVKNTVLGRYLQKSFLDKRVYICLADCVWIAKFSTYNYRERDIDRPTDGIADRTVKKWKGCDGYTYNKIMSNISQIITDNINSEKDILFVFDDAICNEEIVSYFESVLNRKSPPLNIYSKSCRKNLLFSTVEIKKEELGSIDVASMVPQYTGKRYKALKDVHPKKMVSGLKGKYYNDIEFSKVEDTRVDKVIYFNWGPDSPLPSIKQDYFSIEWNGYVRVDIDDVYWFFTKSDDGSRLWIDDDLIIDNWNPPHVSDELSVPVFLEKGLHKIKFKYFESEGYASVRLAWASDRLTKQYQRFYTLEE